CAVGHLTPSEGFYAADGAEEMLDRLRIETIFGQPLLALFQREVPCRREGQNAAAARAIRAVAGDRLGKIHVGLEAHRAAMAAALVLHAVSLREHHVGGRFWQLLAEGALIELRYDGALELVALVDERKPEGKADVTEDLGVLGPHDHRARAHDGGKVAVHESRARHV